MANKLNETHKRIFLAPLPIVGIFMSQSQFGRVAKKYAETEGMILIDIDHIIEKIVFHPDAEDWLEGRKTGKVFNETHFLEFFRNRGKHYEFQFG